MKETKKANICYGLNPQPGKWFQCTKCGDTCLHLVPCPLPLCYFYSQLFSFVFGCCSFFLLFALHQVVFLSYFCSFTQNINFFALLLLASLSFFFVVLYFLNFYVKKNIFACFCASLYFVFYNCVFLKFVILVFLFRLVFFLFIVAFSCFVLLLGFSCDSSCVVHYFVCLMFNLLCFTSLHVTFCCFVVWVIATFCFAKISQYFPKRVFIFTLYFILHILYCTYWAGSEGKAVLGILDILVRIRIQTRIPGSEPLTNGSGSNSGSESFLQ
jgi:hypothetical protein